MADPAAALDVCRLVAALGMSPARRSPQDRARWHQLVGDDPGRDWVVCVVDDDPDMVLMATALGVDAVVFRPPPWFSWHLVMTDIGPDGMAGLAYRLRQWSDKHPDQRIQPS